MAVTDLQPVATKKPSSVSWIRGILLGIVLAVAAMVIAIWAITGFGVFEIGRMLRGGQVHIAVDQPTVVRQVRALERIETVSYTMDKIISGERENPVLPQFLAGDRLLLLVHGEVIAGLDLSQLQPSDVVVHGRSVSIHLPAAEIFTTTIDNDKTRVYSRDTGLFSSADPNLETEVREEAVQQLRASALQDGILKTAEANAHQTIRGMLVTLDFENVEIH